MSTEMPSKREYIKYVHTSNRAHAEIAQGYQNNLINDAIIDSAVSCLKDGMTELELVKELRSVYENTPEDAPERQLTLIQAREIVNAAIEKIEQRT